MKGRKVIAFVLFSGTEINMEYVIILERIMTYMSVAYQLQSKQKDLALMHTRFSLNKLLQNSAEISNPAQLIALLPYHQQIFQQNAAPSSLMTNPKKYYNQSMLKDYMNPSLLENMKV